MPLSVKEHRLLFDTIYTDLQDLVQKVEGMFKEGKSDKEIVNAIKNANRDIPKKAVRIIGKN